MAHTKASTRENKRRRWSTVLTERTGTSKKTTLAAARAAQIKAAREAIKGSGKSVWIRVGDTSKVGTRKLKFGAVTVSNTAPDPTTVAVNVNAGREALKRATDALTKPGVILRLGAHVPRFRADVSEPGMLIRELDGSEQRGRIVNGAFVPAD